ncbi:Enoyl-CoA hydratase [Ferrimonas balearica DSM 9799]|uniref:Enoyl-CoA hydratase n=1 Tax=Ferrimonas balearica (strain DSM 9799 / CCM 4581 / KCTC 23876 / PAT) TaxID=550540 RepID=E1SWM8_FERBD|nr:enoyl-CoA hydratase [Ferrimonas balearica]ADN77490.1 Enoyl-CoA hydratase [Ferrimonas balearica DSM 9799]MBY5980594.1 enoyl-CoA hydratase [Ferrimonas balearica]
MDLITVHRDNAVMVLTLNRPDKRNALTQQMYSALSQALTEAEQDDAIRVILLQGDAHCFTAGNDLNDFLQSGPLTAETPVIQFIQLLPKLTKPLVAAVSGAAVGIGTTVLLHCDLVYASDTAKFQLPFVNLGLVPEAGSSALLPALCGYPKAAELLMFGEPFDVQTAEQIGLINAVVAAEQVLPYALEKAQQLATRPPKALMATKALLKQAQPHDLAAVMEAELARFSDHLVSDETRAVIAAKLAKR